MDSILTSIKALLGIEESDTSFDVDIIVGINTALSILTQLGVGPPGGLVITDKTTPWSSFIGTTLFLESVKTYVHLKVRMLFDPPASSSVIESMNRMLNELEWRISLNSESTTSNSN